MRWLCLLLLWLGVVLAARAAGPVMVMHQVADGESWASLARSYQLSERRLRWEFNRERFMVPLAPDDWIWVPERTLPLPSAMSRPAAAGMPVTASALTPTPVRPDHHEHLPVLGRPDPDSAPKSDQLLLTLASAARAAATDDLDGFVLTQTGLLADDTLSFGTSQLASLPWLNPSDWYWDYQLPLFDHEAELNSQLALPLWKHINGELGVDYRDDRLTYQLGLHYRRPLVPDSTLHIEPLFDYQEESEHRRGGLLFWLEQDELRLGAAQYQPLSSWRSGERPAAGRVWFGEGQLKALPGLSISGRHYQWRGEHLRLFGSGDKYQAAGSSQWALSYAPWRILRLQTSLLNNSENDVETRLRLMLELPLRLAPELWWQTPLHGPAPDYRPLQYHRVMVLERQ
ncbi:inverse autotransporter beta domain-containing protein [Oceanimonas marisflavi]|uniref:inverse autotransporter beta domain-containing protein n=1 Tax=Oceanimonas marisflavi TaxID=2059724 RepID=UPI000D31E8E8|nr:inverse autotransporter beta domain-containing protein [Oceanimonas marisflavi]